MCIVLLEVLTGIQVQLVDDLSVRWSVYRHVIGRFLCLLISPTHRRHAMFCLIPRRLNDRLTAWQTAIHHSALVHVHWRHIPTNRSAARVMHFHLVLCEPDTFATRVLASSTDHMTVSVWGLLKPVKSGAIRISAPFDLFLPVLFQLWFFSFSFSYSYCFSVSISISVSYFA